MAKILPDGTLEYDNITRAVEIQANYLASNQDEYLVDDGIAFYTGLMPWNWGTPDCSHTEWGVWVDGDLWFFSSTSRKELGGKGGTRWAPASKILEHPERYLLQLKDVLRVGWAHPIWPEETIAMKIDRANSMIGLGYDFYGVTADFVNPARVFFKRPWRKVIGTIKKIYCSKAVHVVQTGIVAVFSPRRKFKWAKKNGYRVIEDTAKYAFPDSGFPSVGNPTQKDIDNIVKEIE